MHSSGVWWMWLGFFIFISVVLAIDMFLLGGKKSHRVSTREAFGWVVLWLSCAMIFNFLFWWYLNNTAGPDIANQKALQFFTGYLIEESLSIDNMFAILMVFNYFVVPQELQRRVLLYGVIGAIVMRLLMILSGTWLIAQFHWLLYAFGVFLVFTGIRMAIRQDEPNLAENKLILWLKGHLRLTHEFHNEHFFVRINALWYVTPLFLALIFVEFSDLIFALDSIPAIFAITNDTFIIFTSNIFAILGLRALYFLLVNMAARFYLLKYGIAILLIFIGVKMLIAPWVVLPITLTLSAVVAILATTVLLSLLIPTKIKRNKI